MHLNAPPATAARSARPITMLLEAVGSATITGDGLNQLMQVLSKEWQER